MRLQMRSSVKGLTVLGLAAFLSACGDDIVYRDRDFEEPAAVAGNFMGYSNRDAHKTVCGNCHVGKQGAWRTTAHSDAWATLANSGASRELCEGCHSVSSKGNQASSDNVGWVSTHDVRYQDVQCESCHGPGFVHVSNPDVTANQPLAPLNVASDLTQGCGECHSGSHRPFAEEWSKSRHARVTESRATNPSCISCHEAKGVLQAWGINSSFQEQANPNEHMAITCAVCHDPHEKRNPGQLRFPMDVPQVENNLCMKCHHRRSVPELNSGSGPHSPQGPVLLGEAGWFPPNFQYPTGTLVGSHGSEGNPRLCATCHVNNYVVNDALTGAFSFRATGHSFKATPCADAQGIPTGATSCDISERSFRACTTCHLSETAARSALITSTDRINRLATEISGLLPLIPATEFSTTDNRISTGEGSKFNMQLAQQEGSPVHNPFLIEALLLASIRQIQLDYGLTPTNGLVLEAQLTPRSQK